MNAPFLSGPAAPFDPFQGTSSTTAGVTTFASPADPVLDLLQRWRAADAAQIENEEQTFAAEQAYKATAGESPTPADGGYVFADLPQVGRDTDPDWFEKTRNRLRDDLDEPCKKWWIGYYQACGALSNEGDRLAFLKEDLEKAIIDGPATPLGIAAKIELALYCLPDDPRDDYLPTILQAAKTAAEHLAGRAKA